PAGLVEIALIGSLRDSAIENATARHQLLAQDLASDYEQLLQFHRQAVIQLADQAADSRAINVATLAPLLKWTRDAYSAFGTIAIVDPSGRIVVSDPVTSEDGRSAVGMDVSGRGWFGEILRTRQPLIDLDVGPGQVRGSLVVTIAAPIVDLRDRIRGVVVGEIELATVQVAADRIRVGKTGYAQVTTARGVIIAHRNEEHVRERKDFSELPIWPLVTGANSGRIPRYTDILGDQRLAGFMTVHATGWKIWVNQTRSEVEAELNASYRPLLGWTLLALLVAVTVAVTVASRVSRPVSALRATAGA